MRYGLSVLLVAGMGAGLGGAAETVPAGAETFGAYLMVYFGPQEKLFYAVSDDARNWTALNGGAPVFDAKVRLRDPFVNRAQGKFRMVHTKGWDHPTIFHWESTDLIHWTGGPIDVVPPSGKRAWAPEFYYEPSEDLFCTDISIDMESKKIPSSDMAAVISCWPASISQTIETLPNSPTSRSRNLESMKPVEVSLPR